MRDETISMMRVMSLATPARGAVFSARELPSAVGGNDVADEAMKCLRAGSARNVSKEKTLWQVMQIEFGHRV